MGQYRRRWITVIAAKIVLEYSSPSLARSIMSALEPDNRLSKTQMHVASGVKGKMVYVAISQCPTVETMQSTLEDIFRCVKAAQESMTLAKSTAKDRRKIRKDKRFK